MASAGRKPWEKEIEEDKSMVQLQAKWDDLMGASEQKILHQKVIVLMLYWDKIDESFMDVGDEIRRLEDVLTNRYHYTVLKQSLNDPADKGKSAQVSLHKHLSAAVWRADGEENALLIVYYAGHGNPNPSNGQIVLTGRNYDPETVHPGSEFDDVVWQQAENLMHTAGRPDMFLIFDCCHAGALGEKYRGSHFSRRNFEFLGATTRQGRTRIPGRYSFTSALIWALHKLADKGDESTASHEFTASQLLAMILGAPDFPIAAQTPILVEKGEHALTRLCLAPLPSEGKLSPDEKFPRQTAMEPQRFEFGLCLQFTYDILPSLDDIKDLVKGLRHMSRTHDVNPKHINWKGIHRHKQSMFDMPPRTLEAIAKFRRGLGRNRSQNDISSANTAALTAFRESQHLTRSRTSPLPGKQSRESAMGEALSVGRRRTDPRLGKRNSCAEIWLSRADESQ